MSCLCKPMTICLLWVYSLLYSKLCGEPYNFYSSILILAQIIEETPKLLKAVTCSIGGSTDSSF